MFEVHRQRIVDQIQDPRLIRTQPVWDELAVHEGKGVRRVTGSMPGDQCSEQNLRDDRGQKHGAKFSGPPVNLIRDGGPAPFEDQPETPREKGQSQRKVQSQPVGTHLRIVDETTLYHEPAHHALGQKEQADPDHVETHRRWKQASHEAEQQRDGDDESHDAAQHSMNEFWPEDRAKLRQTHAGIDLLVFGGQLIGGELGLPCRFSQRRKNAGDGSPVGHGQARMGESDHATHHDHQQAGGRDDPQPSFKPRGLGRGSCNLRRSHPYTVREKVGLLRLFSRR